MSAQVYRAVAIATGSDTVASAVGCVEALHDSLPPWCDIVVGISLAPDFVLRRVVEAAGGRGVKIIEAETWLRQNELRNRALDGLEPYDYYLFIDLDSRVAKGCLERAIATHEATKADLVSALIVYGPSIDFGHDDRKIIHFAGGACVFRPDADGRPGMARRHDFDGLPKTVVDNAHGNEPWETELVEFHGVSLTRRAVVALAPFDEGLLALENADLSLCASALGLKKVLDPQVEIIYEGAASAICDLNSYREHWGTDAGQDAVRYFARKYGLPDDGELVALQCGWNSTHVLDIGVIPVTGLSAPVLGDIHAHPVAQTWPQLLDQLGRLGWTDEHLAEIRRVHDLARRLSDGVYHASGKPFICHLIGTASILAAYCAPPILVKAGLLYAADELIVGADGPRSMRGAVRQVGGAEVARIVAKCGEIDFTAIAPPKDDEEIAFYPLASARALIVRIASKIEERLDRANLQSEQTSIGEALWAHGVRILPALGFDALLVALERLRELCAIQRTEPISVAAEHRTGPFRLSDSTADAIALPDDKWLEVAIFLRSEGRENDLVVAPSEFSALGVELTDEVLTPQIVSTMAPGAIVALHKGRLWQHSQQALCAIAATRPIFANDVFVLYSGEGEPIGDEEAVHLGSIKEATDSRQSS